MNTIKLLTLWLFLAATQVLLAQSASVSVADYSSLPAHRSGMIYLKIKDNAQINLPKYKRGDNFGSYPVLKPFIKVLRKLGAKI